MSGWRKVRAKGRVRPRGQMNKGEQSYADHLKMQERAGEIEWFAYEAVKLRLANNTFFTCDFIVMRNDGDIEMHEVKGRKGDGYYAEEDAKIKVKVAAAIYPFRFIVVWPLQGGGWGCEEISSEAKAA